MRILTTPRRRRFRLTAVVAFVLLACVAPATSQQSHPSGPGEDAKQALAKAATGQGKFDEKDARATLEKAGVTGKEADDEIDSLRKAAAEKQRFDKEQKEAAQKAKDAKDQNASGTGDWNFGQVYRDRDYNLTMSVANNCKLAQTVSITYPGNVIVEGPGSVTVPPKSKVDVPMKLILTRPPMPMQPWPIGVNMSCYDIADNLTLVHPKLELVSKTAVGTEITYTCQGTKSTYKLTMHVHQHGPQPPQPPPGGGGDGKPKKPACTAYWNHGEFIPSTTVHAPSQCTGDVRDQAHEFFGPQLDALRTKDPQAWAWVPSASEIDRMSPEDLIAMKARADAQAGSRR